MKSISKEEILQESYFKSGHHKDLFEKFAEKLSATDNRNVLAFCFVASAIGKDFTDHLIYNEYGDFDFEELARISRSWSLSERALLELSLQLLFFGGSFIQEQNSVHDIFSPLDEENTKVAIEGITMTYSDLKVKW